MIEPNILMDMFSIFTLFLVLYGFRLKIWEGSKTTKIVLIYTFLISLVAFKIPCVFLIWLNTAFLLFLFARAIWKKKSIIKG